MYRRAADHGLEFLLAFDGRVHHLEKGYWIKFEITRVKATSKRPHGLSYSFTLHTPDGTRLVGFDNAHDVPPSGSRFKSREEVERVLGERGVGMRVTRTEQSRRTK